MALSPLVFRVDAGPGIGLGHLQRCLALAAACQRAGASSVFLTHASDDVRRRIGPGSRIEALDSSDASGGARDLEQLLALARAVSARAIVVDSYGVDGEYLRAIRAAGFRVTYLDDLAREALPAHVVWNGSPCAREMGYPASDEATTFLLGPTYALLPLALAETTPRDIADVDQILVVVGGDNRHSAMSTLIDVVAGAPGAFDVVAALGPFNPRLDEVEAAAARATRRVTVVNAAPELKPLVMEADLVISAAGQTLYELAALGAPTIAFELFDNQARNLAALAAEGVVRNAGRITDPAFRSRVQSLIAELQSDRAARHRLRDAGRRVLDGHGAERVAAAVMAPA